MYAYRAVDDVEAVAALASAAFAFRHPHRRALAERIAQRVEQGCELFGVYEGERLVAAYMLHPFRMRMREGIVSMGGIGMLCSRLDARGRGAVRKMLSGALETMRERGHAVSVLAPFEPSFYRKYGWELFERRQLLELPLDGVRVPDDDIPHEAVDLPVADEATRSLYNRLASRRHTLVQRGDAQWEARTSVSPWQDNIAARGVVRIDRAGTAVGLIGYDLEGSPDGMTSAFHVNLFLYVDEAAKRAMLRYLRRLSQQVKTVRLDLPLDEDVWPYLVDRPVRREIHDQFMIRMIAMERLDGLSIAADDRTLDIEVVDDQAAWVHGRWRLTVERGTLRVAPTDRASVRCDVGVLSTVMAGFTDLAAMIAAGRATPSASYRGEDLPRRTTFLADYF